MAFKKSKQKSQPDLFARDCGKLEGQRGMGDFYTNCWWCEVKGLCV